MFSKTIAIISRTNGIKALTGLLSPGRTYCAAKTDGKLMNYLKIKMFSYFLKIF
jgi:hypothetical protein